MILYLDTSVIVATLTNEARTQSAQAWLAAQSPETLAISEWVSVEVSSALSIKVRVGAIGLDERAEALSAYRRLVRDTFTVLQIGGPHFGAAARFADEHGLGLRAGDALHLAIAADHGATLCTLDRTLAKAALPLGIDTQLL